MPDVSSPSLFSQPGLPAVLGGRALSAFAAQVLAVAVGWQIYALTHSTAALGFVGLAQFLPMFALILPAGHAADQHNRQKIVLSCQVLEMLATAATAYAAFTHHLTPGMLYALVALFGACKAFEMPAQQTFLPSLVTPALFPRATALSASLFQVASIAGPSLGGLLYGAGAALCYSLCAASFGLAALATASLSIKRPAKARQPATLASVFGGIAFLRRKPAMLGAISLDLFAVLLGGATAMLPVFATDILHAGPIALGLLRASPAVGALMVAAILARYPLGRHAGLWMFGSVVLFGLATIVFGLSRSAGLSVIMLAILGGADVVSVMVRGALVQLGTPDEMRGRVSAVNMLFIGSSNQLGEFESGMLASLTGPVGAVVLGGVGTVLVAGCWMLLFPGLRKLDRLEDITPEG